MPEEPRYSLKKIIIVGVIILIIAAIAGFFFINRKNNGAAPGTKDKNLFPFGQGTTTSPTSAGTVAPGNATLENIGEDPLTVTDGARLRHVTDYPITGFFAQLSKRVVSEPKFDEKTQTMKLVSTLVPVNTVRFNAKQNGFLIDADVTKDAIIVEQKTKTSVPDAEEVWFGDLGQTVTYRTWNDTSRSIDSLVGILPSENQLSYCVNPLTLELKKGTKNTQVAELQRYIKEKLSIAITVDGSYGTKTVALVKTIQKSLGVAETGIVDQVTRDAINADCASIQAEFAKISSEPVSLEGKFLTKNILRGTISPDGTKMFFLRETSIGTVGIVAKSDGTEQKQIFVSPLSEWSPRWVSENVISMTTLASREANGYLYFLDPTNGNFKKILGPVRGLTALVSPDAKTVLYSASTDRGIATQTFTVGSGTAKALDLVTLPEKCTWQDAVRVLCAVPRVIPSNQYPDAWYQGLLSFEDIFWSINTDRGTTTRILSPEQSFDATHLQVSPDESYLYFMNNADRTLWSYRLTE